MAEKKSFEIYTTDCLGNYGVQETDLYVDGNKVEWEKVDPENGSTDGRQYTIVEILQTPHTSDTIYRRCIETE